ncbi:ankyrin repeat domain-containing protein [Tahibacter sp.]|uniref:ankyrin repeat domain-containing protein n=1 Tax=Tahibacter sp. TaxID=2056211 RepID=UPI0028C46170|nr:ankyrin repeat domain-containing protein [Tahibacter sp.]
MLHVFDCDLDDLLSNLPSAQLTYMARETIEASRVRSFLMEWTKPNEVWVEFVGAAQKVFDRKRASKRLRHFAEAVVQAPDDVRARVLLAVGATEDAYAYWALRAALADQERAYGELPPPEFSPDAECSDGRTPLNDALSAGDFRTAAYLLDHGANPNHPDGDDDTPLKTATSYNLDGDDGDMPPQECALPLVRRLLTTTKDVDRWDCFGWTALSGAVRYGFAEAARLLLAAGADPTAGSPGNRAIDHVASVSAHPDLVAALVAARDGPSK